MSATSDNVILLPAVNVTYVSPNTTGSVSYTPAANQSGTAHVTVVSPVLIQVSTIGALQTIFGIDLKSYEALQDAYRRLVAAGAEITGTVDFGFMRTVSIADPDGIRLGLFANTYATDEEGLAAISSQGAPTGPSPTYDPLGPEPPAPKIPASAQIPENAVERISRLPVDAFHELPPIVAAVLRGRGCKVPQPFAGGPLVT